MLRRREISRKLCVVSWCSVFSPFLVLRRRESCQKLCVVSFGCGVLLVLVLRRRENCQKLCVVSFGCGVLLVVVLRRREISRKLCVVSWSVPAWTAQSYQQYNALKNRIIVDNSDFIRIFAAPKNGLKHINNLFTNIYAYNSTISSQRTRGYRREEQISRVGCLSSEKRRMRTCVHNYT